LRSREVRLIAAWSWAEAECIQSASPAIVADGISGAKKAGGLRRPCDEPRGESYEPDSRRHRRMPVHRAGCADPARGRTRRPGAALGPAGEGLEPLPAGRSSDLPALDGQPWKLHRAA